MHPESRRERTVRSDGDAYDHALAEGIIGLYEGEVIRERGPGRNLEAIAFATLERVDWSDHRRLLESIGHAPPAELGAACCTQARESAIAA